MATNQIVAYPLQTGLSGVTAYVYSPSAFIESVVLTESPANTGRYVGTTTALAASTLYHYAVLDSDGNRKGQGVISTDANGVEITNVNLASVINAVMTLAHGTGPWTTLNIAPSAYTLTVNVENEDEVEITTAQVMVVQAGDIRGPIAVNASGQVVIPVSAGVWTLLITAPGFNNHTSTVTIAANTTTTKTLTATSIPESTPGNVTGYLVARDNEGDPVADVSFQFVLQKGSGEPGNSYPADLITKVSGIDGIVSIQLLQSSTYFGRRVKSAGVFGEWVEITVGTVSPLPIPEILGKFAT